MLLCLNSLPLLIFLLPKQLPFLPEVNVLPLHGVSRQHGTFHFSPPPLWLFLHLCPSWALCLCVRTASPTPTQATSACPLRLASFYQSLNVCNLSFYKQGQPHKLFPNSTLCSISILSLSCIWNFEVHLSAFVFPLCPLLHNPNDRPPPPRSVEAAFSRATSDFFTKKTWQYWSSMSSQIFWHSWWPSFLEPLLLCFLWRCVFLAPLLALSDHSSHIGWHVFHSHAKVVPLPIISLLTTASPWVTALTCLALVCIHVTSYQRRGSKRVMLEPDWVQITAPPLASCVHLGKIVNLSKPKILHLWNGANNTMLISQCRALNLLVCTDPWEPGCHI